MPKVKVHRTSPSLDMTPMVDLAFLLVTFFMLISRFAPEEAIQVDTPSSISEKKLPDTNVITISISNDGRVYFGVDGANAQRKLLEKMGEKYGITFTEAEKNAFTRSTAYGLPIASLKSFLALPPEQQKKVAQPGIPTDSTRNELADWIMQARYTNPQAIVAIKGDGASEYPYVGRVIEILQEKKVNRFNLVTDMEAKPKG